MWRKISTCWQEFEGGVWKSILPRDITHVKNELVYFVNDCKDNIQQLFAQATMVKCRKKVMQFAMLFHFLSRGKPNKVQGWEGHLLSATIENIRHAQKHILV